MIILLLPLCISLELLDLILRLASCWRQKISKPVAEGSGGEPPKYLATDFISHLKSSGQRHLFIFLLHLLHLVSFGPSMSAMDTPVPAMPAKVPFATSTVAQGSFALATAAMVPFATNAVATVPKRRIGRSPRAHLRKSRL